VTRGAVTNRKCAGRRCPNLAHPAYRPLCEDCWVDALRNSPNSASRLREARDNASARAAREAAASGG
jgi:hypothetical protein